jgi:hypothetical protein
MHILHSMGYAQELERRMSSFSNFAISFSIICILSGGINSLAQATSGAGGAAIGIGWPLGCIISLVFAVGMAQISSAYPTAGGLYHWGSILGNRFTGWLTAWLNLLGLITVLGAINVGTYYFFMPDRSAPISALKTRRRGPDPVSGGHHRPAGADQPYGHRPDGQAHGLVRLSDLRNGDLALTIVCLVSRRPTSSAVCSPSPTIPAKPEGNVWPAVSGTWVFFARPAAADLYDHRLRRFGAYVGRNRQGGRLSVPRGHGLVGSVVVALFGYIMLCASFFMLPNMDDAAKQGWNVFFWAMDSQVNPTIKDMLYCRHLHLAVPVRSGDGDVGIADDLRLLA